MTDCNLYLVRISFSDILLSNAAEYSSLSDTNLYVNYVSFKVFAKVWMRCLFGFLMF